MTVKVEFVKELMLKGTGVAVIPASLVVADRSTDPVKPLMFVTVMVELAFEPWTIVREEGLEETVKLGVGGG